MRDPIDIGSDRQLFVDDYWIDRIDGARRRLHRPTARETAIAIDRPWERGGVSYLNTFPDEGVYRGWYRCDPVGFRGSDDASFTAYAESDDGIHWRKPHQGVLEFEGSKDNNLVWMGPGINLAPFRDDNPNARDDERYKAFVRVSRELFAIASPDGIRWRKMREEPVLTDWPFDTLNIPFWDTWRGEYVAYTRGVAGTGPFLGGVRWIRRTTSDNFLDWTELVDIDTGDAPMEQFYTNSCVQYERAPGIYLMFPSRFVYERKPTPDWPGGYGVDDAVFMSSRDGLHFDRSFLEAFVRPGLDRENWHERSIYIERGILDTGPGEISLYGMEHKDLPTMRIRRYALRTDGFVSVNAGYSGGEFTTHPLVFAGSDLEINYSTSAVGSVRVEVQDAKGRPQPGLSLDDSAEIFGDEIEGTALWNGNASLAILSGKPIRLRFALQDANLYAFKFR